jgi:hypothetical protein
MRWSLEDKPGGPDVRGIQNIRFIFGLISQYKIIAHYLKFLGIHGKIQASFTHNIHFRRQA